MSIVKVLKKFLAQAVEETVPVKPVSKMVRSLGSRLILPIPFISFSQTDLFQKENTMFLSTDEAVRTIEGGYFS